MGCRSVQRRCSQGFDALVRGYWALLLHLGSRLRRRLRCHLSARNGHPRDRLLRGRAGGSLGGFCTRARGLRRLRKGRGPDCVSRWACQWLRIDRRCATGEILPLFAETLVCREEHSVCACRGCLQCKCTTWLAGQGCLAFLVAPWWVQLLHFFRQYQSKQMVCTRRSRSVSFASAEVVSNWRVSC